MRSFRGYRPVSDWRQAATEAARSRHSIHRRLLQSLAVRVLCINQQYPLVAIGGSASALASEERKRLLRHFLDVEVRVDHFGGFLRHYGGQGNEVGLLYAAQAAEMLDEPRSCAR